MRLDFTLRGLPGHVEVTVEPNLDSAKLGCPPHARGFPVCTATIAYAGHGYDAALGWIQLVRSTDDVSGAAEFQLDPFEPLGRLSHPFCFFGFSPMLFDAPSRAERTDLDWTARSFLCFIAAGEPHEIRALLGFGWGFSIREGSIELAPPMSLAAADWDDCCDSLSVDHPSWTFAPGFRTG